MKRKSLSHVKNSETSKNYCFNLIQPSFSSRCGTSKPSRFKNQTKPLVGFESFIAILAERMMHNIPNSNFSTALCDIKIGGYPDVDDS